MAATPGNGTGPIRMKVAGMDCGSCAATIERGMLAVPGVLSAEVSFTAETLEVTGDVSQSAIANRLRELGFKPADTSTVPTLDASETHGPLGFVRFLWRQPLQRLALTAAAGVMLALFAAPLLPAWFGPSGVDMVFTLATVIVGVPIAAKGLRALARARQITIDLLMVIAAAGALAIGAGGEAVAVMLLFALGEALEAYTAERARGSLRSLLALQPQEATVLEDHDGHVHSSRISIADVAVGARVLVKPGERIPVDGIVIEGASTINQAPVTGESVPVLKSEGDELMAGTVNGEAALTLEVLRPVDQGTIARIAKLVEEAQAQRSPAERFIDRFARWYTPAVILLALAVVTIPVLGFGQPLLQSASGEQGWLYRGLALLIIACPCALVISIPVTVVSGLTRLAQLGVLVRGGAQLDRLADIRIVAFDKTGTLTAGKPTVTGLRGSDCSHEDELADCVSCDDLVALAAVIERSSEHPMAHAILQAAGRRDVAHRHGVPTDVVAVPGKGISGAMGDGRRVTVGNELMFDEGFSGRNAMGERADSLKADGATVMYVAEDDRVTGYISVQDEIRDATAAALAALKSMRPSITTVMLTGDTAPSARRVAAAVGNIDQVHAGLLPDRKLEAIRSLRRQGPTAMVGDGINDAPALAQADIGIAMGSGGTAQAMETADVVLMQDELSRVPGALALAQRARRLIKQNIVLSLGLKLAFLGLAIPGLATLWMAVLADVGATLLVTLNGMRLLRQDRGNAFEARS